MFSGPTNSRHTATLSHDYATPSEPALGAPFGALHDCTLAFAYQIQRIRPKSGTGMPRPPLVRAGK